MKRAVWVLALGFLYSDIAQADVYVRSSGLNGLGVNQTWYQGKKRREQTAVNMGGLKTGGVEITRVDKGVVWTLDEENLIYKERPIFIPDTPGDNIQVPATAKPDEKWVDLPKEEKDFCEPELITFPQKQVIAGFEATGYQAVCKDRDQLGMPPMTMWMAPAKGTLGQFDKEVKAFDKAWRNELYKDMTPADRKISEEFFEAFGSAAGQMLLGMKADKLPKAVPLKMEQVGAMPDRPTGNSVLLEILEIKTDGVDPQLFEIPAGYRKIDNEEEYYNLQLKKGWKQMGPQAEAMMNTIMQGQPGFGGPAPADAVPVPHQNTTVQAAAEQPVIDEPAQASEPTSAQDEQETDDFDARDYTQ